MENPMKNIVTRVLGAEDGVTPVSTRLILVGKFYFFP